MGRASLGLWLLDDRCWSGWIGDAGNRGERVTDRRETARGTLLLHPDDTVLVCVRALDAGERLAFDGEPVTLRDGIGVGHKVARSAGRAGDKVVKYGMPIGSLNHDVAAGDWVHLHNMKSDYIGAHTRSGQQA